MLSFKKEEFADTAAEEEEDTYDGTERPPEDDA